MKRVTWLRGLLVGKRAWQQMKDMRTSFLVKNVFYTRLLCLLWLALDDLSDTLPLLSVSRGGCF